MNNMTRTIRRLAAVAAVAVVLAGFGARDAAAESCGCVNVVQNNGVIVNSLVAPEPEVVNVVPHNPHLYAVSDLP